MALNLLQRMCGIATATHLYVDAVAGTGCRILGTRKTAPGLRAFDRLAVRDGGAADHRFGLFDRILVKDNHRVIAGGVAAALEAVSRNARANVTVEVEVESEEDLREALRGGVRILLIDNQTAETVARWKAIVREAGASAEIEASGDMTLARVRDFAVAGADSISVGRITHSVEAADISLEISSPAEGVRRR